MWNLKVGTTNERSSFEETFFFFKHGIHVYFGALHEVMMKVYVEPMSLRQSVSELVSGQ
jgi:heme/copper-type cytochrome/quinol oxidase subunit 3